VATSATFITYFFIKYIIQLYSMSTDSVNKTIIIKKCFLFEVFTVLMVNITVN